MSRRSVTVLLLLLVAFAAVRVEAGEKSRQGDEAYYIGIDPFIANVRLSNGRIAGTPLTPFLAVHSLDDMNELCRSMPRVREAITVTTQRYPLETEGTYINTVGFAERLRKAINRQFGRNMVDRVYIAKGVNTKSSGAASRLIGGRLGCQRIQELPREVERYRR